MQFITITSQGQITIPAKMRRELGLDTAKKAIVRKEKNRIIIEPEGDIMKLAGALKHRAFKNKSVQETMKIEKAAIQNRWADTWKTKTR